MINKPHRGSRTPRRTESSSSTKRNPARAPSPDDGVLETDSEDNEFANGFEHALEHGDNISSDEEEDARDSLREVADSGGVGSWQPDDWDEKEDESGEEGESGEEEEEEEEAEDTVRKDRSESMRLVCYLSSVGVTVLMRTTLFQRRLRDGEMT